MDIRLILSILGTIGAFIFGPLAIYLAIRQRQERRPTFVYDKIELQTKNHPDVSINFKDEKIENLSRSRLLLFNRGKKEIRSEDLPQNVKPTIKFSDNVRLLSYRVIESSNAAIGFNVEQIDQATLAMNFEYLNYNDGAVIDLLYEEPEHDTDEQAESDKKSKIDGKKIPAELQAIVKGAKAPRIHKFVAPVTRKTIVWFMVGLLVWLTGVGYLEYSAFAKAAAEQGKQWLGFGALQIIVIFFTAIFFGDFFSRLSKPTPKFAATIFES